MRFIFLLLLLLSGCNYIEASKSDVVFLRGWGYFPSNGMGNMSEELKKLGIISYDGSHFTNYIGEKSQILIGHSMGADEVLLLVASNPQIQYELVILIDPFCPIERPSNIKKLILIRGWDIGWVKADIYYNFSVPHVFIDDDSRVQEIVINEIKNYFREKRTKEILNF